MSRTRSRSKPAPSYLLHKATGQARCLINSKCHYRGKHGTPESLEKYHRLITELWNPTGEPKPATT